MRPATAPQLDRSVRQAGPRPSSLGYWTGGALIAIGIVGALVWALIGWLGLMHHVDGFQRTAVPGTATLHITSTSTGVLYFEGARHTPAFSASDVTVLAPDKTKIPVDRYARDLRYDVPGENNRVGRAVAAFRPIMPGDYVVTVTGPSVGTLAIGDDVVWDAVPHIIGAGAVFLLGLGLGVTLIVTTAVRRNRTGTSRPATNSTK